MQWIKKILSSITAVALCSPIIGYSANASAQEIISPNERDQYIEEFQQDQHITPVIEGAGGVSDEELEEYHRIVRTSLESADPKERYVEGEMWSDKVGIPEKVTKEEADKAETLVAEQQLTPRSHSTRSPRCRHFLFSRHQVCGAILHRYEQLGGQLSWLMHPTEPMFLNPDGQGYRQKFQNGFIYWHPRTGAHAVSTRSAQIWARNGWEAGWMGYPRGGEVPVEGETLVDGLMKGWVQIFEGGRIYRSPFQQVASIRGAILDKWLSLGGTNSELGFPIADEAGTPDRRGRFSRFQNGTIYWHPETGAHSVTGALALIWEQAGFENSEYGYPTGESSINPNGDIVQSFQHKELNLTDYIGSDGVIEINGKEYSKRLLAFLGVEALGVGLPRNSNANSMQVDNYQPRAATQHMTVPGFRFPGERVTIVPIPEDYEYQPNWHGFGDNLRDYCTYSPDEYAPLEGNAGRPVADFRGPCAKHDLCLDPDYSKIQGTNMECHRIFRNDLHKTCKGVYSAGSESRKLCLTRADYYYSAVKRKNP